MSSGDLYDPDQSAVDTRLVKPWNVAFRAQRDVGLNIPIDFRTGPTVSLSPACFYNNQYEHNAFQKCFSNLLAVGFTRFTVDVYWDPLQSVWSLCPVELPPLDNEVTETISIVSGPTLTMSTDTFDANIPLSTALPPRDILEFERRQDGPGSTSVATPVDASSTATSSGLSSAGPTTSSLSTAAPANPTIVSFPTTDGPPLMQIGSYNCTAMMTLGFLTGLLENFLDVTSTTTDTAITLLTLNVHAASSWQDPNAPASQLSQNQLPESGDLLSDVMKGNLTDETYTPSILRSQRENLNESWFDVDWENRPRQGYYNFSKDANDNLYTVNGWPSEVYIEFQEQYRLVVSYGTIDPQMRLYNIGTDLDFIFPPGTISNYQNVSFETAGQLSSGCLFAASETTVTPESNSSWAISTAPSLDIGATPNLLVPIPSIANLTSCGITALLNETLANTTADKNPLPYAAYLHSTQWSWAPGEPLNATSSGSGSTGNRCAIMTISPFPGRWHATDCNSRHQVACHDPTQPYHWEISSGDSEYEAAETLCRAPLTFDVPHTALENAHLLAAMRSRREGTDEPVYIDINSLDVADCWVIGLNSTCPYIQSIDTNRTRIVVVPTVAAVIIFVLAALTFFIKCASNRRKSKRGRKRRMVGGWEYEGVPS
ncbi:lectin C-type domain-containing protein [Dothidotthia symphoricarpi CBS 119687]|uniref:Maintenance of telomere capping protein 6 n=1 Tax=Dothidotthia symphoricarpi CBS 119687 TaxID=1392245 RepID=A0A6A6A832_9PLEO|nr:lectin C-type domain-containing protein [Dothidotthia symphoricarpi CBS 119687]KAF2127716.1 lectin C-type domain-containing protein [Dothidotthia symphoricarpi CBS 119687]